MNTSHGWEEDGKMEHQRPLGLHHMSLLKTQYLCKQNVLWTQRHTQCPEEMKFHDNSEESINRRALVQAEWWGGVKSAGPLIKKKQSSSLSLQHNGILDGCLRLLMDTHTRTCTCICTHKQTLARSHTQNWILIRLHRGKAAVSLLCKAPRCKRIIISPSSKMDYMRC